MGRVVSVYERRGKDETFVMTVEVIDANPGRLWIHVLAVAPPASSLLVEANAPARHRVGDLVEIQPSASWRFSLTEHPESPAPT